MHADQAQNIGFSDIYFPAHIGQRLSLQDFDAAARNGPLFVYPIVEQKIGFKVDHARINIGAESHARAQRTAVAEALGTAPLVRVQYVFSHAGEPVQFTTNWLDSRFFSVSYELAEGEF
ncbi:GntR family transcriptional regulator [Bordetella pertussis]|nr:UTRA domain-containing protein [Bordetella pertussis]CFP42732.1 GntR family transcriptional regulator [Bordetella pertussis]CFV97187.1 GntR family transcriptional regulator [Bordetella pertussis]CPI17361.1 GntR family transcriptional regulator [Bordetella pertussis]CPM42322.1 GntR family transcriptional regulator [Bordetella pertussis]